jgi:23S rRNA pseudouridine2605 synthase
LVRLQKYLSDQGVASRRQAEAWIRAGQVICNGQPAQIGQKIDPTQDDIWARGKKVSLLEPPPKVYWLFYKPDKTLVTRKGTDIKERTTIYDLESLKDLSFPVKTVGRLDYRTEGLLLLSNDGEMIHRLTHPSFGMERFYQVLISGKLAEKDLESLRTGVLLKDGLASCSIQYAHGKNLGKSKGSFYFLSVQEGRNRLVRRLMEHFGHTVIRLVRYGFGELRLDEDLKPGSYRALTREEISYLKKAVDLNS